MTVDLLIHIPPYSGVLHVSPKETSRSPGEHLNLISRVLTRELATKQAEWERGQCSFRTVEEVRAALESVAALRGTLHS